MPSARLPLSQTYIAVAAMLGASACATGTPPVSSNAPVLANSPCFVADTSAPTADTIYAIDPGPSGPKAGEMLADCSGNPIGSRSQPSVVNWQPPANVDVRDVLDRGIPGTAGRKPDVVVTRNADVLAYAASRSDYFVAPMVWDRTYVLLTTGADSAAAIPSDDERDALARNAVTSDARGAVAPFTWLTDSACVTNPLPTPASASPVLGYASSDQIARQLAERIVALAAARNRPAWIPATITPTIGTALRLTPIAIDSISDALTTGQIAGAVAPLAREPRRPCLASDTTLDRLRGIPLVDSRPHVIVRRGSGAAFYVGIDGKLWFDRRGPQ